MRMLHNMFDTLLATLRHELQKEDTQLMNCISPEEVLATRLHHLVHGR